MKIKKKSLYFIYKYLVLGKKLENSLTALISEAKDEHKITPESIGNLIGAIIRRFTRAWSIIAILTLAPTIATIFILFQQNKILQKQTDFFEYQYDNDQIVRNAEEIGSKLVKKEIALDHLIKSLKKRNREFSRLTFQNIRMEKTNLTGLNLDSINFNSANFSESTINSTTIRNSSFKNAIMLFSDLSESKFIGCDFTNSMVGHRRSIRNGELDPLNYERAIQNKGKLNFMTFESCDFTNTSFNHCDFRYSNFSNNKWEINNINKDLYSAAIFLDVQGLDEQIKSALKENNAIVDIEGIRHHLNEAKKQLEDLQNRNGTPKLIRTIIDAIKFYEELEKHYK